MKVVIAGGTGLMGTALSSAFASAGEEVAILTRGVGERRPVKGVRFVPWDGSSVGDWASAVDGAAAVVNLAGENLSSSPWTQERKQVILESRVDPGGALVEAIRAASTRPGVLIQSSAVGYYGPGGDETITEETPPGNDFLARVCVRWEASTGEVEALGVRRVVIRTGVVLSMRGGALPRLVTPARLFAGSRLGNGRQWFPWIHLADQVSAIRFLIEDEAAEGAYNLAAPGIVTNGRFARVLGKVLGRPSFMRAPAFAIRLAFGEMSTVVLDGQRIAPRRLLGLGFQFRYPDLEPALRDLLKAKAAAA